MVKAISLNLSTCRGKFTKLEMKKGQNQRHQGNTETHKEILWKLVLNKLENLKEMGNFLDTYHLLKLNQDQTSNLNIPIIPSEMQSLKVIPPTKNKNKSLEPEGFSAEFYQPFKKKK